jgi:heme/copper-type cytochrome/quinol oxidase subunit 3
MIAGDRYNTILALILTVILAAIFTGLQAMEYYEASFSIADSVYGSVFYMLTGFHGFHVFVGTVFLTVCLFRIIRNHYTTNHHNGFEAAI